MNIAATVFEILLLIWFLGAVTTYKIGRRVLVLGEGIKSAEFFMLVLYSSGILLRQVFPAVGKWYLFGVLMLWLIVGFFCHWYYTIFGASEKKIEGYNLCFRDTIRIFPASKKRLIPDLYHIVLHVLIIANIVLILL